MIIFFINPFFRIEITYRKVERLRLVSVVKYHLNLTLTNGLLKCKHTGLAVQQKMMFCFSLLRKF